jgi:predicted PurR-regulated permease PerM
MAPAPDTKTKTPARVDPFKITLLIFAIVAAMYFTGEVLKPLALSILLSFALVPVTRFLERHGLPRVVAVVLTVVLALGALGGIGFIVGQQLTALADLLPGYQRNIEAKVNSFIKPGQQTTVDRLEEMAERVTAKIQTRQRTESAANKGSESAPGEKPPSERIVQPQPVRVVQLPTIQERLSSLVGPYLEFLGVSSFVLILVLFILMDREGLRDRIVELFGPHRVSLTTRTMEEISHRISRYLATFAVVNTGVGLVIGLGLWFIGVHYAVLWGCLAGMFRFIPYVGPAVAFVLPLIFSIAQFPGWIQPLEVIALYAAVETLLNAYLEPVLYGKTTGISALSLLVAALFWTWLWGALGLLLSTPLTVCLAVLGKYVPSLRFFAILLGDETELEPNVRFYQRLVSLDREGAIEVVEAELARHPRADVFDQVLLPALVRAERDAAREDLNETEQIFIWRVIGDILDSLEGKPDFSLTATSTGSPTAASATTSAPEATAPVVVAGLAIHEHADSLVLRMLQIMLEPAHCTLEIITGVDSSLQVAEAVSEHSPRLVVVSYLPPQGRSLARYLVRQLHARFPELPIIAGHWGEPETLDPDSERLTASGASYVAPSLAAARDRILKTALPPAEAREMLGSPQTALT